METKRNRPKRPPLGSRSTTRSISLIRPPGKVSVEHVVNVLGRLNAAPAPQTAATSLQVRLAPLANTARYDSLRADSVDNTPEEACHDA